MDLAKQKCIPCEGGTPPFTRAEAELYLVKVPEWHLHGEAIQRTYLLHTFAEAMKFVNQVAMLAEAEGHHPDVTISYNRVTLRLMTHAVGGLSMNDFVLAAKINKIVL